jgi:DENN (AEX-3) domain/Inhibitor of Apoptosis domain/uDENN domain
VRMGDPVVGGEGEEVSSEEAEMKQTLLDRYSWLANKGAGARATVFAEIAFDEDEDDSHGSAEREEEDASPSGAPPLPSSSPPARPRKATASDQRLVECVAVVELGPPSADDGKPEPFVSHQFPELPADREVMSKPQKERADYMQSVPIFCFPCVSSSEDLADQLHQEFMFVLTDELGGQKWGYCRRITSPSPIPDADSTPACLCVVTRLPWGKVWRSVLESMERAVANRPNDMPGVSDGFDRLKKFTEAIQDVRPVPSPTSSFRIACENICALSFTAPTANEILFQSNFKAMFSMLSVREVVGVFEAFLLERRVVVCSRDLTKVSDTVHALLALLHPFSWPGIFIPVLPQALLDYCMSPVPFLVGIEDSMKSELAALPTDGGVVFIDLDDGFANLPTDETPYFTEHAESSLLDPEIRTHDDGSPDNFPLRRKLEKIVSSAKKNNFDSRAIVGGFHDWKCTVFENYRRHIKTHTDTEGNVETQIDVDAWVLAARGDRNSNTLFLQELSQTQIFAQFLQEAEEHPSVMYFQFDQFTAAMEEAKRERRQQQKERFRSLKRTASKQVVTKGTTLRSKTRNVVTTLRKTRKREPERKGSDEIFRGTEPQKQTHSTASPSPQSTMGSAPSAHATVGPASERDGSVPTSGADHQQSMDDLDMLEQSLRSLDLQQKEPASAAGSSPPVGNPAGSSPPTGNPAPSSVDSVGDPSSPAGGRHKNPKKRAFVLGAKKIYANLDSKKQEIRERLENKRKYQAALKLASWRLATFQDPATRNASALARDPEWNDLSELLPKVEFYAAATNLPPAEKMVAAGLYFSPTPEVLDRCICFACGAKLFRWSPTDDPMREHTRMRPRCVVVSDGGAGGGSVTMRESPPTPSSDAAAGGSAAVSESPPPQSSEGTLMTESSWSVSVPSAKKAAEASTPEPRTLLSTRDPVESEAPPAAPFPEEDSSPAKSSGTDSPPVESSAGGDSSPAASSGTDDLSAVESSGTDTATLLSDLDALDSKTKALEEEKARCIAAEDYLKAQEAKTGLEDVEDQRTKLRSQVRDRRKEFADKIQGLRDSMKEKVAQEDYESCHRLKLAIDEVSKDLELIDSHEASEA